uniref:Uncharacterized protein n=1 Tax=Timema genevievae TaxID=629358 RepID=A0A7R9PRG3_TIMGE|nr:unnamed protein product [Timema genevievae]
MLSLTFLHHLSKPISTLLLFSSRFLLELASTTNSKSSARAITPTTSGSASISSNTIRDDLRGEDWVIVEEEKTGSLWRRRRLGHCGGGEDWVIVERGEDWVIVDDDDDWVMFSFKLITPDGTDHGLHSFVVSIRNPMTLLPYPGVTVGDLGEKLGLNGIDNGFVMFDHYRIPRENLLNKNGDVTPEGKYVAPMKDRKKHLEAAQSHNYEIQVNVTEVKRNLMPVNCADRLGGTRP